MSDGTFRPSGATPWSSYNTPRIWAMVEGEDDPEAWRQVAALGSMAGLLKDQRSRLEAAKQKLIDAWPPEKNKAARAFVNEMDELLFTMQVNKDIADSNASSLGQILDALRRAKDQIAPLYQAYLDKSDDWVPGWWDHAEDELDEKARQHMREAERLVADPGNAITAPSIYEFQPDESRTRPSDGSGSDGPPGRPVTGIGGSVGASGGLAVPHDPPPPLPRQESSNPVQGAGGVQGPGLAEVISPSPIAPSSTPPSALAPATGNPGGLAQPGLVIGGGVPGGLPGRGAVGSRGGFTPFGGGPQRGLPSGAVIGSSPGRGTAGPVKPTPPPWLPQGPAPAPRGGPKAGGRPAGPLAMPIGAGRPPARDKRGEAMSTDPDNPWVTEVGVAPIIEPSRKQYRHDPGPGVIGWQG
ncbi:hypothetical protein [Actinoplanes sp. NPDC049599]|uniref:hypothetical protein n=1 Tax=Actinoplanes sp. NPDC049599 TaxID=3363903 RepID=UPI0037BD8863